MIREEELLEIRASDVWEGLDNRAANALIREGHSSPQQAGELSDEQLLLIDNFGEKSLVALRKFLGHWPSEQLLPIAKIHYRCPWTEESQLVGPSDYKIFIPILPKSEGVQFRVLVNCPCGQRHELATGEFD